MSCSFLLILLFSRFKNLFIFRLMQTSVTTQYISKLQWVVKASCVNKPMIHLFFCCWTMKIQQKIRFNFNRKFLFLQMTFPKRYAIQSLFIYRKKSVGNSGGKKLKERETKSTHKITKIGIFVSILRLHVFSLGGPLVFLFLKKLIPILFT